MSSPLADPIHLYEVRLKRYWCCTFTWISDRAWVIQSRRCGVSETTPKFMDLQICNWEGHRGYQSIIPPNWWYAKSLRTADWNGSNALQEATSMICPPSFSPLLSHNCPFWDPWFGVRHIKYFISKAKAQFSDLHISFCYVDSMVNHSLVFYQIKRKFIVK